jgi:hypothetical protein
MTPIYWEPWEHSYAIEERNLMLGIDHNGMPLYADGLTIAELMHEAESQRSARKKVETAQKRRCRAGQEKGTRRA